MKSISFLVSVQDVKRLIILLISLELLITLVFIAFSYLRYPAGVLYSLVDLDSETSLPTWLSSTQLFVVGLLFLLFSRQSFAKISSTSRFFKLGGLGFIFLSIDEAAMIHENITKLLSRRDWVPSFPGGHGIWVPLYLGIGLLLLPFLVRPLLALWKHYRRETVIFFAGAFLFLAGGMGVEVFSYFLIQAEDLAQFLPLEHSVEEFLEMLGITVILLGSLLLAGRGLGEDEVVAETMPKRGPVSVPHGATPHEKLPFVSRYDQGSPD